MTHSGGFVFGAVPEALRLIVGWMEALDEGEQLEASLIALLEVLKGHRATLLRLRMDTGAQTVISRAEFARSDVSLSESMLSFPQYLLGHGLGKAQPGSVWHLSELGRELSEDDRSGPRLRIADELTREMSVVVLDPGSRASMILEIQFTRWLSARETESLSMLMSLFSRIWQHRRPDLDELIAGRRSGTPIGAGARSALDAANPAALSRAEYRICRLLGQGLTAKAIARSLEVSESTVRSHLRSIYAKTETSGQCELMARLLGPGEAGRETAAALAASAAGAPPRLPAAARRRP